METTTQDPTTEVTELLLVEDTQIELSQAFSPNGLDPVIDKIKKEALSHVPDLSTAQGRAAIASVAHKVAKSKKGLDDMRLDLVSEMKAKCKGIDAEGKRMRDILDDLKVEVRQPLTDWEGAEEERVARLKGELKWVRDLSSTESCHSLCSGSLTKRKDELLKASVDKDYYLEFYDEAIAVKAETLNRLEVLITQAKKAEADAAELEKLRKDKEDREEKDKKEFERKAKEQGKAIAEEAEKKEKEVKRKLGISDSIERIADQVKIAINTRLDSGELSKRIVDIEEIEIDDYYAEFKDDAKAAKEKSIQGLEVLLKEVINTEDEAKQAEEDRIENERQQAIDDERDRVKAEQDKADAEKQERERNADHIRTCKQDASEGLQNQLGYSKELSDELVETIYQKLIPNITLNL